jgi:alkaline phosphatase
MKLSVLLSYACVSFFIFSCHSIRYTASNAHAHNDYAHPQPFYTAWEAGFGSIEADVFPVNDSLYVAHDSAKIHSSRSLQRLYIQPLAAAMETPKQHEVRLLIDIKKDYERSLLLLLQEIKPLLPYLTTTENPNRITLLITGSRPKPLDYGKYPSYVFFDDDLKQAHSPEEWKRVGLVSLPFNKITKWDGLTPINEADRNAVKHKIDSVHAAGKPIRFWAAPDTPDSWRLQRKLHADLIGTDKIDDLANWLKKGQK